jgi:predicted MPP superfamily phosphohydrolase
VLFLLIFLVVAVLVVGAGHYYLWRRLVRDVTTSRRVRRVGFWVFAALLALTVGTFVGEDVLPQAIVTPLAWAGYLWLALMFYLLVILAVLELPALVAKVVLWRARGRPAQLVTVGTADPTDATAPVEAQPSIAGTYQSRRLFLGRAVAVTAGVAAVGLVGSGVGTALGVPQVKRIQIPLAKLPRSADGLRIALASDIHLGPLNGAGRTRRIVELINELDADLVAIVGDLVDGTVEDLGQAAAPLADLRSRHGTYFVTGNHEYFSGYEPWIDEVTRLGMRPLRNQRVPLPEGIDLAGVNDVAGGAYGDGPDFEAALGDRDASRAVVLLSHQPVQAYDAARHGVDLQLSGHTHGGQMVPFNLVVRASGQPVVSGLGEVDGMPVYVTNGAGFWGPPVRVGAPPDVTLVELRSP